jgi:hypothetical protein
MNTANEVFVICRNCGNRVPKRSACGVGGSADRLVWTCNECIKQGAMDKVFAPIGEQVRRLTKPEGEQS